MYTFDTNAIIYYLKEDNDAMVIIEDILAKNTPVYISFLTEAELFSFSNLDNQEIEKIENILKTLAVIPVDSRIARIAGMIRSKYKTDLADSIIAATAMFTGTSLVTRNVKDFKNIPNIYLSKI